MNKYNFALLILLLCSFACNQPKEFSQVLEASTSSQKEAVVENGNLIFKSSDGGKSWQNISNGLPIDSYLDGFVEKENLLYVRAGDDWYHTNKNTQNAKWEKEIAFGKLISFSGCKPASAYSEQFKGQTIHHIFERAGGTVLVACDYGLFKSNDGGKSFKEVQSGGWARKMVASNGAILATSQRGILRSTDEGESWDPVISEGGVGITLENIEGGIAAITYNTTSKTRRMRASYDDGKTWQAIDAGLPDNASISSILQVNDYLLCGHPAGVFKSSDKGKTWTMVLHSNDDKVFNLSNSGNVIYAISRAEGC